MKTKTKPSLEAPDTAPAAVSAAVAREYPEEGNNNAQENGISAGALAALSRSAGVSLTYFWGRWGLPLPRPVKLVYVRGAPLGMPKIDEPTQQQIDEWHAKYVSEVTRIFNEHKGTLSDYAEKQLEMR